MPDLDSDHQEPTTLLGFNVVRSGLVYFAMILAMGAVATLPFNIWGFSIIAIVFPVFVVSHLEGTRFGQAHPSKLPKGGLWRVALKLTVVMVLITILFSGVVGYYMGIFDVLRVGFDSELVHFLIGYVIRAFLWTIVLMFVLARIFYSMGMSRGAKLRRQSYDHS